MRSSLLCRILLAGVLGGAAGNATPIAGFVVAVPSAPIGHLRPRANGSRHARRWTKQMSIFDVRQRKLDEQLDGPLNVCRGC